MGKFMVKLVSLLTLLWAFSTSARGLDVHCDSNESGYYLEDGCYLEENLNIHEPFTLNFIDADKWNDTIRFNIPSHNNVSVIPSGIFTRFLKLGKVRISTGLKRIHMDDFKNADALKTLELQDNKLQVIPSNVFSNAPNLETVDLSNNDVTSIEDFAFEGPNKLDTIFLQYNNLTTLKRYTFAGAEKLLAINIFNNRIETIEDGTFDLPNLQVLYAWDNPIHSLSVNLFVGAPKLIYISLSRCSLSHIGQTFYNVNSLKTILLDDNRIEDIDLVSFGKMPALEILTLEKSGFSFGKISETGFVNSSVTSLDLSNNGLFNSDVLNRLTLLGYINLEDLHLEENLFADIDGIDHIKVKFPNITKLGLSNNKLTCEWIEKAVEILKKQNVSVSNNYRVPKEDTKSFEETICV